MILIMFSSFLLCMDDTPEKLAEGTPCTADDAPLPNTGITEPAGVGGCPDGMTALPQDPAVCMDRWEAHLEEVTGSGNAPWSPYKNPEDRTMIAKSASGAVPQAYINQVQADEACAQAGKRLCTNAEWIMACKGTSNSTYPYGNDFVADACNITRTVHPAVEYFETEDVWIYSELDHPCLNQLDSTVDKSGENTGCAAEGNIYDMHGNLNEWTSDLDGTLRGGYYYDGVINGVGCNYAITAHNLYYRDFSTGFRCCADNGP